MCERHLSLRHPPFLPSLKAFTYVCYCGQSKEHTFPEVDDPMVPDACRDDVVVEHRFAFRDVTEQLPRPEVGELGASRRRVDPEYLGGDLHG